MTKEEIIFLKDIGTDQQGIRNLSNIDLSVKTGEILGITGLSNSGITTLEEVLTGHLVPSSGKIYLKGQAGQLRSLLNAAEKGIFEINETTQPIERMTASENIQVLHKFCWADFIVDKKRNEHFTRLLYDMFDVDSDPRQLACHLSQLERLEIMILRALHSGAKVIVCLRIGDDLNITEESQFRDFLTKVRDKGTAIVLLSMDIEKVMRYSDRIMVIRNGMFVYECSARDAELADIRRHTFTEKKREVSYSDSEYQKRNILLSNIDIYGREKPFSIQLSSGKAVGITGTGLENNYALSKIFNGTLASGFRVTDEKGEKPFGIWRKNNLQDIYCLSSLFWKNMLFRNLSGKENIQLRSLRRFHYQYGILSRKMLDVSFQDFCRSRGIDESNFNKPIRHMDYEDINHIVLYSLLFEPPKFLVLDHSLYAIDEEMKRDLFYCLEELKTSGTAVLMTGISEQLIGLFCDEVINI